MKQLSFLLFILISFSASAQIKKMTSEDLLTGEIKTWIEVTDSLTKKVKIFNYSEQLPALWSTPNGKLNVSPVGDYKNIIGYTPNVTLDSAKVNPTTPYSIPIELDRNESVLKPLRVSSISPWIDGRYHWGGH